jgi:AraC-like DNA-binding protein
LPIGPHHTLEKTGSRSCPSACLVFGGSLMSMEVLANAEIQDGYRPASRVRGQGAVRHADHANDQSAPVVVTRPGRVKISVLRLDPGAPRSFELAESADTFALLLPVSGGARVFLDDASIPLMQPNAVVVGRGGGRIELSQDAALLVLQLPRVAAQICASAHHGGARRVARNALRLDLAQADRLLRALTDLVLCDADEEQGALVLGELVSALATQHGADAFFPKSRSLSFVRAQLDRSGSALLSHAELAGKAGITGKTLQRGFKACLGMTVTQYSLAVRLHGARICLRCDWELRSLSEIAQGAGFQTTVSFSRAYQKLFDETPTQTRTLVFRMSIGRHIDST